MAGLTEPDEGRVLLGGEDVTAHPPERRAVNLVFQSYALFPHLDVRANVEYGPRAHGLDPAEAQTRVSETLAALELDALAGRRVSEISGGQAQRVALARALVNRPKVLLLDEPLSALDLQLRKQMQHELRRIHRTFRTTFVYVTHDQAEALTMSDRIVVMNAGRIEQVGTPPEVYGDPHSEFVAGFVGESSILRGRLEARDGDHALVRLADVGAAVEARTRAADLHQGSPVAVVVRPEAVRLAGPGDGVLEGTRRRRLVRGRLLRPARRARPVASAVQLDLPAAEPAIPRPGETISLRVDRDTAVAVPAAPAG